MAKMKPTKTADELPIVTVAAICERMMEEGDRVISIIRIVDTVTMIEPAFHEKALKPGESPGVALPLTAAICLKAGRSRVKQTLEVAFVDPKKNREKMGRITVEFKKPTPDTIQEMVGVNVRIPIKFPWRGFGLYWFELEVMDKVIARMPLVIKKGDLVSQPATSKKSP